MIKGIIVYLIKRLVSKGLSGYVSKFKNFPKETVISTCFSLFIEEKYSSVDKRFSQYSAETLYLYGFLAN